MSDQYLEYLSRAGALGVLAFVVIALLRGWIVTGREFQRVREERDRAVAVLDTYYQTTKAALDSLMESMKR